MQRGIFSKISLRALIISWLTAASVFLLTNLLLMPSVLGINASLILRYMASLVAGPDILLDSSATSWILGLLVHYVLALVFTLVIVVVIFRWGLLVGLLGGAVLGLALYAINLYAMTLLFEWFFAINNTLLLLSHILFGATAGAVYELFDDYDTPLLQEQAR